MMVREMNGYIQTYVRTYVHTYTHTRARAHLDKQRGENE